MNVARRVNVKETVLDALENSQYQWRSVDGISREVKIPMQCVKMALNNLQSDDLVLAQQFPDNKERYSHLGQYISNRSVMQRVRSVLSDKF